MRVHILGSGSDGNAIVLESSRQRIMVDAGFGIRELARRLKTVDVAPESVSALIVTHEHHDHVRGAGAAARRWHWPVYATAGTLKVKGDAARRESGERSLPISVAIDRPGPAMPTRKKRIVKHVVDTRSEVVLDDFSVRFIKAPHDAREPVSLVATVRSTGERVGIAYDIGHLTERFIRSFSECDMLLLESNHDTQLLRTGPYPWSVKQRVSGPNGHLSNAECALMARDCVHRGLRHLVLCHLSQVNNRPEIALRTMRTALRGAGFRGTLQAAPQHSTVTLGGAMQIELAL
ncbi:MAG TPA: MBL fold metallo-hydrolase [Gemmatimonadaceae bacterium]